MKVRFILPATIRKRFPLTGHRGYKLWSLQNVSDALSYLLNNICIRFGEKLYKQIVGIPIGTNCAPLVADLFLFCCEVDFMTSLSFDNQADIIEAFNATSIHLDDLFNIDNPYLCNVSRPTNKPRQWKSMLIHQGWFNLQP